MEIWVHILYVWCLVIFQVWHTHLFVSTPSTFWDLHFSRVQRDITAMTSSPSTSPCRCVCPRVWNSSYKFGASFTNSPTKSSMENLSKFSMVFGPWYSERFGVSKPFISRKSFDGCSNSRTLASNCCTFCISCASRSGVSEVLGRLAEATHSIPNMCFVCALPTAFENVFGNAVLISCETILELKAVDVKWVESSCWTAFFLAWGPSEDAEQYRFLSHFVTSVHFALSAIVLFSSSCTIGKVVWWMCLSCCRAWARALHDGRERARVTSQHCHWMYCITSIHPLLHQRSWLLGPKGNGGKDLEVVSATWQEQLNHPPLHQLLVLDLLYAT